VLVDVNANGRLDIVVSLVTGYLDARLNLGNGSQWQVTAFTGFTPTPLHEIISGDFDGDRDIDLFGVRLQDGSWYGVTLSNTDGAGIYSVTSTNLLCYSPDTPHSLVSGDYDLDGDIDALMMIRSVPDEYVEVMLNDGQGTLYAQYDFTLDHSVDDLAVCDMNGDYYLDFVASGAGTATIGYCYGGESHIEQLYSIPSGIADLTLGDFEGDAFPDVVAIDSTGANVYRFLNNAGNFYQLDTLSAQLHGVSLAIADFSGDLSIDMAYVDAVTGQIGLLSTGVPDYVCGDVNGDHSINIADLTYLVSNLFRGGPDPVVWESGDVNNTGTINLADVTYLVSSLFRGGPDPVCE
jgi:hypothetical protein